MNAIKLLAAGLIVCLPGMIAQADEKKSDNAKLMVGKWEVTKTFEQGGPGIGSIVEFTKDGKMKVTHKMGDQSETIEGTYKLEGDKFTFTLKAGENEIKKTITIKKISKSEMMTTDDDGHEVGLKRAK
jgi:uncharacterized protein (TIGR03066 family)